MKNTDKIKAVNKKVTIIKETLEEVLIIFDSINYDNVTPENTNILKETADFVDSALDKLKELHTDYHNMYNGENIVTKAHKEGILKKRRPRINESRN